uniref:RNA helicase n=1 Tax=Eptatretus burgeri TaxID=7764 RepID=A0A8C4QI58_EPTBU
MALSGREELRFFDMGLDDRIVKAIAKLGWVRPTAIQERAIPLGLEGKDVLARARTGSGKTAAYAIPMIQRILTAKKVLQEQMVRALILVPTKELGHQVKTMVSQLAGCCSHDLRVSDVSMQIDYSAQKPFLMEKPDVLVGTPSRVLGHLSRRNVELRDSLEVLVVDEADLLLSFGFESDLHTLLGHLPKIYQSFLMSATFNEDVEALKRLILHNPVVLKLEESHLPPCSQLLQYHMKCEEEERFLLIIALIKLGLVRGKTLLFVNTVERAYRLRLFLEQFLVRCCVLNGELPIHSRCHIIEQFNQGLYNFIVATDESSLLQSANQSQSQGAAVSKKKKKKNAKKVTKAAKDKEYGVSRGIDFQNVSNVINFDFPPTVDAYIHRVGRTARAHQQGTALTFVSHCEVHLLEEVEQILSGGDDGKSVLKPYQFDMKEIEGFRYRCKDATRAVTKQAIKEARLKEIRQELINSKQLKTYFEDNPKDLHILRHDKSLHPSTIKPHMKNVPEYLVPSTLQGVIQPLVGKRKLQPKGNIAARKSFKKQRQDPLKNFKYTGK